MRHHSLSSLRMLLLAAFWLGAVGCAVPEGAASEARSDAVAAVHDAAGAHAAHVEPSAHAGAPNANGYSLYDLSSTWRDQTGAERRLAELAGRVRVVAMVYTSCAATCPLIVADLKHVEASLPAQRRGDVGFVLVSLDPERDTPGRMTEWAAQTGLDPARWTLLSGDDGAVRELAAALAVRYQTQPDGEVAHTNAITVLDTDGAVVHQQSGQGDDARVTAAAVARLLR
ncbi:MAG TPA: SCO family protein [Gemmatimonadaceae bacterium]|nr:SCO family protein [Gemmatimonadaceae bacterium]